MSDRDDDHGRFVPHPADEEFHTYDATDEEEESSRGPLLIAGIILLLAAFGGVLFFAYQQGMKEGMRQAPPTIQAEEGPAKVAPDDPGGMEIPHQDKRIYDRITGTDSEDGEVERLLPRAEEPMDLPVSGKEPAGQESTSKTPNQSAADEEEPEASSGESQSTPVEEAVIPGGDSGGGATTSQRSGQGDYVVQIAALRSADAARDRFAGLKEQHGDLLGGTEADVQRADLGEKGVFYRLRIGYFADKGAAETLCGKLKARDLDCLVRTR